MLHLFLKRFLTNISVVYQLVLGFPPALLLTSPGKNTTLVLVQVPTIQYTQWCIGGVYAVYQPPGFFDSVYSPQ